MGPGPDIQLFNHYQLNWPKLHHQPQDARPLVEAPPDILRFLEITMDTKQPREDYIELIHLAARAVGLRVDGTLRRPTQSTLDGKSYLLAEDRAYISGK